MHNKSHINYNMKATSAATKARAATVDKAPDNSASAKEPKK